MCSYIGDPMIAARAAAESHEQVAVYVIALGLGVSLVALHFDRDARRMNAIKILCLLGVVFAVANFPQRRILVLLMMALAAGSMILWRSNTRWSDVPLLLATIYASLAMGHAQWHLSAHFCDRFDSHWFKVAI